jgi:futalosine hydrolase
MLILVPTAREQMIVAAELGPAVLQAHRLELVGFGPVAAAARTAALLAEGRPTAVLLLGIAGSLDERLKLGGAAWFQRVACHGVGVGTGPEFLSAGEVGWPQWPGDPAAGLAAVGDELPLTLPALEGQRSEAVPVGLLLSACAASATVADAALRRNKFPAAMAEDMEGFAVALACQLAAVPCQIVRGISNRAGDREKANWQVEQALRAAAALARDQLMEAG